jgi:tetratricopeptide (TPR) repeat protein
VTAGNQTTDEMAQVWLQLLPQGPGDRRRELDQAMLEHRLDRNPADFEANLNLGAVMMSRLNPQGAVTAFEAAVAADPNRLDARNMLGLAFAATGRINEAIEQYRMVLRSEPGDIRARFNLANALVRARKLDEAIEDYRAVLAAVPDDAIAKERLAAALKAKSGP